MNIILLERIEKLGQMGELVSVKAGYARNFLLPQGKAIFASKQNIKMFEEKKSQLEGENITRKTPRLAEKGQAHHIYNCRRLLGKQNRF